MPVPVTGPYLFEDLPVGTVFTCLPKYDHEWYEKVEGGSRRVNLDGTPHPNAPAFKKHGPSPVDPWAPCYLEDKG